MFYEYASGDWRLAAYQYANGGYVFASTGAGELVRLESTEAGSAAGPDLILFRNSASPSAADFLGRLKFDGEDSGGVQTTYTSIEAQIDDRTGGTEDGTLLIKTMQNATLTTVFDISTVVGVAANTTITGTLTQTSAAAGISTTVSSTEGG